MALQLNGDAFPADLERKSRYLPENPPLRGENGRAVPVAAGLRSVTLRYGLLTPTEFAFFEDMTPGNGNGAFLADDDTILYDRSGDLQTYSYAVLHPPQFESFNGNAYFNVTVTIKLPAPTS